MIPRQPTSTNPHPEQSVLPAAREIDTGGDTGGATGRNHQSLSSLATSVSGLVREYPGPSLLIGAGLAWMLVSREQRKAVPLPTRLRSRALQRKDHLQEVAGSAREGLLEAAQHAKESALHARESAAERVEGVRLSANERLEHARTSLHEHAEHGREVYQSLLEENPMILGAVAVACGLAIGLLLPSTEKEDQLMGPTRDHLLDQARSIVDNARQAAVESLRSGAETVKAHLDEAAVEAKAALEVSVENAKEAVKEELSSDAASGSTDMNMDVMGAGVQDMDPMERMDHLAEEIVRDDLAIQYDDSEQSDLAYSDLSDDSTDSSLSREHESGL
jgi:ElaB/YqjD/DUF883 family membrane-anchored ribosome-binding protein